MNEKEAREIVRELSTDSYDRWKAEGYLEAIEKAERLESILQSVLKESQQLSNYSAFWSYSDALHFKIKEALAEWGKVK